MEYLCDFRPHVWNYGFKYTCWVQQSSSRIIRQPGTVIKAFKGQHLPGKTNSDVEALNINECAIEYFPKGLHRIFPNLSDITIRSCGLKKITREDLQSFHSLEFLDLNTNKLTNLPNDLFINHNLRSVDFMNNKIDTLSSKLLKPIQHSLVKADFRYQQCTPSFNELFEKNQIGSIESFMKSIDEKFLPPDESQNDIKEHFANFEKLFDSGVFSDFIVKAEKADFKVHKCILAAHSSVLQTMFESDMAEVRHGILIIGSFSVDSVEEFLRFFYSGAVKSSFNAMELYALASKYDVKVLKVICESHILDNLSDLEVLELFEVFNLGYLHDSDELKLQAFTQIENSYGTLEKELLNQPERLRNLIETLEKGSKMLAGCKEKD